MKVFYEGNRPSVGSKWFTFLSYLAVWLVVGGALTWGPGFAHGIEVKVGRFALVGSLLAWIPLPVTIGIAVAMPSRVIFKLLVGHVIVWLLFVSWVWGHWH